MEQRAAVSPIEDKGAQTETVPKYSDCVCFCNE